MLSLHCCREEQKVQVDKYGNKTARCSTCGTLYTVGFNQEVKRDVLGYILLEGKGKSELG